MASYEPLASQIQECYDEEQGAHSTSLGTHPNNGNSSFMQATFNSVNLLLGIGILSSPYNLQEGGLLGLGILFLCGAMFCYTAYTLGLCVSRDRKISTYQEIAELAFGRRCRIVISLLLYLELLGVLVGFTISLGDNLVKLFPGVELHLGWIRVAPEHFLPLVAVFVVLPTVWVRDLSWLSYVSMGGVASYLVIVVAVTCAGVFDDIGFHYSVPLVNFGNLATVTGLSAYCYSAHVVFPSIYSSIKNPSQYPKVLVVSFLIATLIYTGFAFVGATMFGDEIQSQVTLNLPSYLVVAKICLWVVVLIPLTKYSIALNPIAVELEGFLPDQQSRTARCLSTALLRTMLMAVIVSLAFALPYFDTMLSFVGSALSMTMCVVFPCAFYVKIFGTQISKWESVLNYAMVLVALFMGITGSVDSIKKLILHNNPIQVDNSGFFPY